jgi:hypothetical protein
VVKSHVEVPHHHHLARLLAWSNYCPRIMT